MARSRNTQNGSASPCQVMHGAWLAPRLAPNHISTSICTCKKTESRGTVELKKSCMPWCIPLYAFLVVA